MTAALKYFWRLWRVLCDRTAAVASAMHLLTGLHSKLITATPIINHSCRGRHRYSPQTFVLGIAHDIIIIISIVRKHNKTFIIREKLPAPNENKFFSFFLRQYEFDFLPPPLFCRLHLLFLMTLCVSGIWKCSQLRSSGFTKHVLNWNFRDKKANLLRKHARECVRVGKVGRVMISQ